MQGKIGVPKLAQQLFYTLKLRNHWSIVTKLDLFQLCSRLLRAPSLNTTFWESRLTCPLEILTVFCCVWNGSLQMTWLWSCTVVFTAHRLGKWYIRAGNVIATFIGQLHNQDLLRLLMGFPSSWLQYLSLRWQLTLNLIKPSLLSALLENTCQEMNKTK